MSWTSEKHKGMKLDSIGHYRCRSIRKNIHAQCYEVPEIPATYQCRVSNFEYFMDDNFYGEIKAVLCNNPINYFGILFWGCEIPIICQGEDRPILSEDYIKNVLLPIVNKQK